jgi:hypothetical protein
VHEERGKCGRGMGEIRKDARRPADPGIELLLVVVVSSSQKW